MRFPQELVLHDKWTGEPADQFNLALIKFETPSQFVPVMLPTRQVDALLLESAIAVKWEIEAEGPKGVVLGFVPIEYCNQIWDGLVPGGMWCAFAFAEPDCSGVSHSDTNACPCTTCS